MVTWCVVPVPPCCSPPNVTLPGPGSEKIDLVITLGGDGTILHASSLFKSGAVPPVLSFSMGTLGFLLPFREGVSGKNIRDFRSDNLPLDVDDFARALESVFEGNTTILYRMRLSCSFYDKSGAQIDGGHQGP